jgi:hypothetical protein
MVERKSREAPRPDATVRLRVTMRGYIGLRVKLG